MPNSSTRRPVCSTATARPTRRPCSGSPELPGRRFAAQALGTTDGLGGLSELAQQRAMARLRGADTAELTARIESLGPVPLPDLPALFAEPAELVETARCGEERAATLLA
jgi:hypothetical protein